MALKRPEGLSPCYLSLMSPDIDNSHQFAWTFRGTSLSDYQTQFTITIYDTNGNSVATYTSATRNMFCDASEVGYNFQIGTKYSWSVITYNQDGLVSDPSVKADFYYDSCPAVPNVVWTYIPNQGEVIIRNTYFAEFKNNLLDILGDYTNVPSSLVSQVNNLFTGDIIPSKKDFDVFQSIIDYLISTLENTTVIAPISIYDLISDSLGISDLEKIRNCISSILTVPPLPIGSVSINANTPSMYAMQSVTATSDGKGDTTINVAWTAGSAADQTGSFVFDQVSPSRDIRYYLVVFNYGPDGIYASELYYKASEISNGSSRSFDMNWNGLYDPNNLKDAQHILKVTVVDHRGNQSSPVSKTVTYGSNFKIPMGVDHYEVSYYKASLTDTTYNTNGTWSSVGTPTGTSIVHTVSGASGKFFYRVRAIDSTGLATDWMYSSGVTFDPLNPPSTPTGLRATSVTNSRIDFAWNSVPTAEKYNVQFDPHSANGYGPWTTANTASWNDQLNANTTYTIKVQAENRAGTSNWATIKITTDKNSYGKSYDSVHAHTWADNGVGWYADQGVHHTYVYSGKRTTANNRGQWYFPYETMRADLAGAEITGISVSIQRMSERYDSTPYYPRFFLHDRTTEQWSKNHGGVPPVLGPFGSGWTSNVSFKAGERKWVSLPNEYIEWIRDGKATGLMLHEPDGSPYLKFETFAQIYVSYKK